MISYHWGSSQKLVKKVSEKLNQQNIKTWLDLNEMHGSLNDRIAEAIEQAFCVIPFLSIAVENWVAIKPKGPFFKKV